MSRFDYECDCGHSFSTDQPEGSLVKCYNCGNKVAVPIYDSLKPISFREKYRYKDDDIEDLFEAGLEYIIQECADKGISFLKEKIDNISKNKNGKIIKAVDIAKTFIWSSIITTCPNCNEKFKTSKYNEGEKGFCCNCKTTFDIEKSAETVAFEFYMDEK